MWFRRKPGSQARPATDSSPQRPGGIPGLKAFLIVLLTAGASVGAVAGMKHMERRVLSGQVGPVPARVVTTLTSWPDWMPRSLAASINGALLPKNPQYNDPGLLEQVRRRAAANPFVDTVVNVQKRVWPKDPGIGEVLVSLKYRKPAAKVDVGGGKYIYVDEHGTVLPSANIPLYMLTAGRAGKGGRVQCFARGETVPPGALEIRYPTIMGVSDKLPAAGQRYDSPELDAGLRLAELIRPYAWSGQIKSINIVANYSGAMDREQPYLDMTAQVPSGQPTTIKFGRFPDPKGDVEIPPQQKLDGLDLYVKTQNGKLAGTADKINLQLDQVSYTPYGNATWTPPGPVR